MASFTAPTASTKNESTARIIFVPGMLVNEGTPSTTPKTTNRATSPLPKILARSTHDGIVDFAFDSRSPPTNSINLLVERGSSAHAGSTVGKGGGSHSIGASKSELRVSSSLSAWPLVLSSARGLGAAGATLWNSSPSLSREDSPLRRLARSATGSNIGRVVTAGGESCGGVSFSSGGRGRLAPARSSDSRSSSPKTFAGASHRRSCSGCIHL
mmetsp:Transcript_6809/g.22598  ORF Transcript_6809/g.22598 Transcript_6809/m.22598 type:complete len:213 (-) Transcript_6809:19-657(-)